jgi:hypothetical protein
MKYRSGVVIFYWMIVEFAYNNSRAPTSVEDMNYTVLLM